MPTSTGDKLSEHPVPAGSEPLNERESEILQLVAAGFSNQEIADKLFLALTTVKWYIRQIYYKIGVGSRTQAIAFAHNNHLLNPAIAPPAPHATLENPYKGLQAFQTSDTADFFGREALLQTLLQRLTESGNAARFLAIVGPSGSGKSSLVKAGLIPAIQHGEIPGLQPSLIVEMLPGSRPLDELKAALSRLAGASASALKEHLQREDFQLAQIAPLILPADESQLVLVIDQFEEIFTLVESEAVCRRFMELIYTAVTEEYSRVRVILTLRADFYDRPLRYRRFGELMRRCTEIVLPLALDELERAIIKPAEQVQVAFEDGLVASIMADVSHQAGTLPLLQYALTELFEQRHDHLLTHASYRQIGKVVGALAKQADAVYLALDSAGQATVHQMFLRLVTLGEGTEDTRRRVLHSELMGLAADPDLLQEILDVYTTHRLLTMDYDPISHTPTVEVAHEAVLREWERLRDWLNESRNDIRLQRQLAHAAEDWRKAQGDHSFLLRGLRLQQFEIWQAETQFALTQAERAFLQASLHSREQEHQAEQQRQAREALLERRSRRFLRGLVAVLLLATIGALTLTAVARNQQNIAQENEAEAQRQQQIAQANEAEARSLALASSAQLALNEGRTAEATTFAAAALQIDTENTLAQRVLDLIESAPVQSGIYQQNPNFSPDPDDSELSFAMISHFGPPYEFGNTVKKGMEDACTFLNATCQWFGEYDMDFDAMADYWQAALAMNPDGIGTTRVDSGHSGNGF